MPRLPPAGLGSSCSAEGGPPDPERTDPARDLTTSDAPPPGATATELGQSGPESPLPPPSGAGNPNPPDPNPRYRLVGEIARGAMGVVYRGRDTYFGRDVAVKVLLEAHAHKPELRRRFFEEARITARLQHPAIVTIYDAGELPDGRPFYAMRLVNGPTLDELLKNRQQPAENRSRLLKVFETVCDALAYAHASGVIHRDLKPANVMVGGFGVVKVMDWGVAKVLPHSPLAEPADPKPATPGAVDPCDPLHALTQFGRVLGTPAYMAPEQARGDIDRLDERTDVFGLGGILCAILTGQPPHAGTDCRKVHKQAAGADLADAFDRLHRCGADPELTLLARRCLAPDPADRPRDTGALVRYLAAYTEHTARRAERDLVRFFDLSLDLFCIAGLNGYFRRVNSNFPRVLGYTAEELMTRPFIDFVHPDDRDRTHAEVTRLAQGESSVRFRNRYRNAGGDYRWLEWTAKSIPEEAVIFAVARDVTDVVRLENELRGLAGE